MTDPIAGPDAVAEAVAPDERVLVVDAPLGRDAVPPVRIDQAIAGDMTQPQVKRHGWVLQVIVEPLAGLDDDILHHIADIDPLLHTAIEPHLHQAPQRIAMPLERLRTRCRVARLRTR